eukprot:15435423-Alexandrium_andersonii.AAC.1
MSESAMFWAVQCGPCSQSVAVAKCALQHSGSLLWALWSDQRVCAAHAYAVCKLTPVRAACC